MYFPSVSNLFYIRTMSAISLQVEVYGFHRAHAGQQLTCGKNKDSECYCYAKYSLSAPVTFLAQLHTLFTCFFATVLTTLCPSGYGIGP